MKMEKNMDNQNYIDWHKLYQAKTDIDWKKAVTELPSQKKMYNWRAFAMLEYIRRMIENGKLGNEIIEIISKYQYWILDEVND